MAWDWEQQLVSVVTANKLTSAHTKIENQALHSFALRLRDECRPCDT